MWRPKICYVFWRRQKEKNLSTLKSTMLSPVLYVGRDPMLEWVPWKVTKLPTTDNYDEKHSLSLQKALLTVPYSIPASCNMWCIWFLFDFYKLWLPFSKINPWEQGILCQVKTPATWVWVCFAHSGSYCELCLGQTTLVNRTLNRAGRCWSELCYWPAGWSQTRNVSY